MNYKSYIDPKNVRLLAHSITFALANQYDWNWHQAAAIFDYVEQNIRYIPDPTGFNLIRRPLETLNLGGGDCEDQAILLSSLYEALGIQTRIIVCHADDRSHALCQVNFGRADTSEVADNLAVYYSQRNIDTRSGFSWEYGDDVIWLFADTAMCKYFGDNQGLINNGYIQERPGSHRWYWTNPVKVHI